MKIIQQYIRFIQWVNYKIFLERKFKRLIKECNKVDKVIKKQEAYILDRNKEVSYIQTRRKTVLATLKCIQDSKRNKQINLVGKEIKGSKIKKFWNKLFKFDGWVLYCNKAKQFKLLKVKNLKNLYRMKKKEMYNIHEMEGMYKNKPMFLIVYPYAITLNVDNRGELAYDAESYYTYVDHATKGNLLKVGQDMGLKDLIKKNMPIIIIGIILLALMFTPEGQELLKSFTGGGATKTGGLT